MNDILNLTYIQFKNIVEGIGIKIGFDMRLSYATVSEKVVEIEESPLFSKETIDENAKFTMADALKMQELVQKG